jgi:hypothetical protein
LATPSSANLAAAVTNETGSGLLVFGTTPTLNQPDIVGVTTNSNANAGSVGEYVSNSATGVSMSNGVVKNMTSISLTAGDWDVWGTVRMAPTGTMTVIAGSVSTTSATHSTGIGFSQLNLSGFTAGGTQATPISSTRVSISATTTVFLTGQSNFSSGTVTGEGYMAARRIR